MPETEHSQCDSIENDEPLKDTPRLGPKDRFCFRCDPKADCFTRCCNNVSILLTPYDVLRMKRALGIDSSEFLQKYTFPMCSQDKQIPVVFLKMNDGSADCPFVSAQGCGIYKSRPWACRMYPLGMAEPETPDYEARRFFFVVQEELCHGHNVGDGQSVSEWIADQGIELYDLAQAAFRHLLFHPDWAKPESQTPQKLSMFYMACYDLDSFRRFVFETRFLEFFDVDEMQVAALRTDDEELLQFAFDWLAFSLFHEKTMKLKKKVVTQQPETAAHITRTASPE